MLRRAHAFWEQSALDLKEARRRVKAGNFLDSSFFSYQGAVNALTCVCYLNGSPRAAKDSAMRLLGVCIQADPRFTELAEACGVLDSVQERNPYSAERDGEEEKRFARQCLDQGQAVRKAVGGYLKDNRKRFALR